MLRGTCGTLQWWGPRGSQGLKVSQEGTNVHFSNVHFVLCQIFGLDHLTPPFHAFFSPSPLYCFLTKWIKVSNHEPQSGSSNAEMSRRTKCTFERCTFVTLWVSLHQQLPESTKIASKEPKSFTQQKGNPKERCWMSQLHNSSGNQIVMISL